MGRLSHHHLPEIPPIDVLMMDKPQEPPLGVGESASVPSAAAIANAIYDATGVRFRELPFTPERVLAGFRPPAFRRRPRPGSSRAALGDKNRGFWAGLGLGLAGLLARAPSRCRCAARSTQPRPRAPASIRKKPSRAAGCWPRSGDCAVCHTAPGGARLAGGLAIETPFGIVHSTNITPDPGTGIGNWSFDAFRRAMREGIGRDGQHLYPVFPYNHFTRTSDADLEAIYAYLMSETPVVAKAKPNGLAFPMNIRPLMTAWNALYLSPGAYQPDPARSAEWNRGAYLVEGLGHCGACHTPRNALGAEIKSRRFAGGVAEGWEAPPLTDLSQSPVPWTEDALFTYLRTGFSPAHGPAAGPMAPVIHELQALPDSDLRAMASYLASFSKPVPAEAETAAIATADARNAGAMLPSAGPGGRLFQGACAVCHAPSAPPAFRGEAQPRLQQQSAERPAGQSHPHHPGRGAEARDRQHGRDARLRPRADGRPDRRTRFLPPPPICPWPETLDGSRADRRENPRGAIPCRSLSVNEAENG